MLASKWFQKRGLRRNISKIFERPNRLIEPGKKIGDIEERDYSRDEEWNQISHRKRGGHVWREDLLGFESIKKSAAKA